MAKKKKSVFMGKVAQNAHKQQTQNSSYGYLSLPKGIEIFKEDAKTRSRLDFLPYIVTCDNHPDRDEEYQTAVKGSLWYKRPFWLHRDIGASGEAVLCRKTIGEKCPICEYRAKMIKDGVAWDDDTVKALKSKMRNLYVVNPKNSKEYEDAPHIWEISQFLFQDKLNEELAEDEAYQVFPDLEEGLTVQIRFSEETLGKNKFADTSRIDFRERSEVYDESIMDDIPSLDDILQVLSYKEMKNLFFGGLDMDMDDVEEADIIIEDDEDDDEEETSRSRKRAKKTTRRTPVVEEDDDDDDDDEEEDEEPAPRKKQSISRKSKKPTKKKVVEEEEEDEDDFDEDYTTPSDDDDDEEDQEYVECVACEGSGKSSKGKTCPICKGKGEVLSSLEQEEYDDEEEDLAEKLMAEAKKSKKRMKRPSPKQAPVEEDDEEEEEEEVAPKPLKRKASKGKKAVTKDTCPHGHVFGKDCEEYDECDKCTEWEKCIDAK